MAMPKVGQLRIGQQKLAGEGRLPRAVRPGDDDDALVVCHGSYDPRSSRNYFEPGPFSSSLIHHENVIQL
jgi:hypothetical protein